MATLADVVALGYDVTEHMRHGDPPKFGEEDTRVIVWLVEGYGTYTQVSEDDQETIDALADPQPPQHFLVNEMVGAEINVLTMFGYQVEVVIPGFPDAPDAANATFNVTDPDGHVQEGMTVAELEDLAVEVQTPSEEVTPVE